MTLRRAITAVVLLGGLSAAARAETLTGTVRDTTNNATLSGVTVTLVELSISRTTNGSGFYDFGDQPGGNYTVRAALSGYVTQDKSVTLQTEKMPPANPRNFRTR